MPYWCWHLPRYAISRFGMGGKHFRHTILMIRIFAPIVVAISILIYYASSSLCHGYALPRASHISLFDTWWCTFLFVFILNWAEFLLARMLTHPEVTTLTVLLNKFQSAAEGRLTIDFPGCRPGPSHPEAPGQRLQLRHYPQVT